MSCAARCTWSMKPVSGSSKRNSTLAALTLLRFPCGASTCSEELLSASTAPTLKAPSSSYQTFMGVAAVASASAAALLGVGDYIEPRMQREDLVDAGESEHAVQMLAEIGEAVVAALNHELSGARVPAHGLPVVQHFVAGGDH